jgi:uncharacterized OB-fold protein
MLHGLPLPRRDTDSEQFWSGLDEGRLCLPRCPACGTFRWPPGPVCPSCGELGAEWVTSEGRGEVFSWVVVHVALLDALADQLPYAVGLVTVAEGVRLVGTIEGCDPDQVRAGMPVQARVVAAGEHGPGALTFVAEPQDG